jgi:Chromate transporter
MSPQDRSAWEQRGGRTRFDAKGRPVFVIRKQIDGRRYEISTKRHTLAEWERFERDPSTVSRAATGRRRLSTRRAFAGSSQPAATPARCVACRSLTRAQHGVRKNRPSFVGVEGPSVSRARRAGAAFARRTTVPRGCVIIDRRRRALRFVLLDGAMSLFADFTYEGAGDRRPAPGGVWARAARSWGSRAVRASLESTSSRRRREQRPTDITAAPLVAGILAALRAHPGPRAGRARGDVSMSAMCAAGPPKAVNPRRSGALVALVATVGIFLPSFVLVAATAPFIPRLRRSAIAGAFLDGVNAASLGLMAAVSLQLARTAVVDTVTAAIAVVSLALLLRFRINSTWLIVVGALVGVASHAT